MKYGDDIKIRKWSRTLERGKPFVFIGNEIDGRLFCPIFYEFKNFEKLSEKFPEILKSIKGEGEWAFELYQVPKEYRIWHRWGYYRYPNRGKKVFRHSYMNIAINAVVMDEECILLSGDQLFYEDSITKPHKLIEVRKIEINWKSLAN